MIDREKALRAISGISSRRSPATNQGGGSKAIRRAARCCAECLESRILFAWNMTLSTNADFGVSSSTASGTTTFTATATGANLSWNSIQSALQAGNSVVVSSGSTGAEAGNITDQSGAQLSFSGSNRKLTIQSGTGTGLVGNISVDEIRMSAAGSSIVLAANGNVSTGLLSGGSNASPASLTSAAITAATGSITAMGSPFPGAIYATTTALKASTGIGSSTTPLSTQTASLSAQTSTGDIIISNTGNLMIGGGVISGVNGVQATTSGSVVLVNAGSVTANMNGDFFSAPAGITVTTASSGNILLGGNYYYSANSSGGTVALNAAGNLLIGDTASGSSGSIDGGGNVVLSAGGNINVDESSVVEARGSGTITATAGGSISLLATTSSMTAARFVTQGGAINLTTGAGGALTLDSNNDRSTTHTIWTGDGGSGTITISTDHLLFNPATNDDIEDGSASNGFGTVIIQPVTNNEAIQLGTTTDAELDLSNSELGRITAYVLRIGGTATTGNITITAPISVTAPNVYTLSLRTDGSISDSATSDTILTSKFAARAGSGISLDSAPEPLSSDDNWAVRNTTSGNIRIGGTGDMTLTTADTLDGTAGNQLGNFAPGGTTTISITGWTDFDLNLTSAATLNITSGQTAGTFNGAVLIAPAIAITAAKQIGVSTSTSSLAFQSNANAVSIVNTGGLTIAPVGGVNSSSGRGTTWISASGPITFATNTTSAGTLTVTTYETASESGSPLPPPDENITINSGVTVESTSGDIKLSAADSSVAQSGSTIKSDSGAISLSIGVGDIDGDAGLVLNGTLSAGTGGIQLTGNSFSLTGPISDSGPFTLSDTGTATLSGALSGSGIITKNGSGALALNGPLPAKIALTANAGSTTIVRSNGTSIRQLAFAFINISAGANVIFANTSSTLGNYSNHANRTLAIVDAGGLNIASGGTLDIGDNSMLLKYSSGNKSATDSMINSLVTSGYAGGAWSGTGITSSEANYDAYFGSSARAVGWADQYDVGVNSFEGDSADVADGNEIMIKFTYYGDTDLDGKVASSDSANFSTGVHLSGNAYWEFGDFDYSGGKLTASDSQAFSTGLAAYKTFGQL